MSDDCGRHRHHHGALLLLLLMTGAAGAGVVATGGKSGGMWFVFGFLFCLLLLVWIGGGWASEIAIERAMIHLCRPCALNGNILNAIECGL